MKNGEIVRIWLTVLVAFFVLPIVVRVWVLWVGLLWGEGALR